MQLGVIQENRHCIMDLRANTDHSQEHLATADACTQPWQLKLKVGSQVAAEARAAVKACFLPSLLITAVLRLLEVKMRSNKQARHLAHILDSK